MHHLIPVEPGTAACVMFATGAITAGSCVIETIVYWRRIRARRATLETWMNDQRDTEIADGDDLFDRWNEAARLEIHRKKAQAATVLWVLGAGIHTGLAVLAETACM